MISVIIPTLNGAKPLDRLLRSLADQSVPSEVVVIDSSSDDDTAAVAGSRGARVISVSRRDFNHGRTRNQAAKEAKGDILVFMTQDALPVNRTALECLSAPLTDPAVAASYGRQIPRDDARPAEKFARAFNYPEKGALKGIDDFGMLGIKTFFFSNVFSAVRRDEFEELGGFPEDLLMFEDMLYAARLIMKGYKVAYVSAAGVFHSHDLGLIQVFHRYFEAGCSFRRNAWFLDLTRGDREGLLFLREELKHLFNSGKYGSLFSALAEAAGKYTGYNLGLYHHRLPSFVCRWFLKQAP